MVTQDGGVNQFFKGDHQACDRAWAALEEGVEAGNADENRRRWKEFSLRMARHLAMEEEVLFPAFEHATGMKDSGPTAVMRMEHRQMRGLMQDMARRADEGNFDGVLDQGDTLMMLIQQHNAKEEGMLYPMADNVLKGAWTGIAEKLLEYTARPLA